MKQEINKITSIFPLNKSKEFTIDEAMDLIPLLTSITSKTKQELSKLNAQLNSTDLRKTSEIQDQINYALMSWSDKVRRLGVMPVALGKIRFLSEEENILWEFPSKNLMTY